eukprot:1626280-Prymnesium_polylepis.1
MQAPPPPAVCSPCSLCPARQRTAEGPSPPPDPAAVNTARTAPGSPHERSRSAAAPTTRAARTSEEPKHSSHRPPRRRGRQAASGGAAAAGSRARRRRES